MSITLTRNFTEMPIYTYWKNQKGCLGAETAKTNFQKSKQTPNI
jgi:hypothetical protein